MPEGYTHAALARAAAQDAGWRVTHPEAFMAGANGPDMLFCFEVWKSGDKRRMNLPQLGERLHHENTRALLKALHENAQTPAQRDYFMGFLAHYAVDCTMHPYVVAMTRPGMPYGRRGGHGYFEIALDSELCRRHTGRESIRVSEMCPLLPGSDLAEVAQQLRRAIGAALGLEVPVEYIADAFSHCTFLRSLFPSPLRVKYAVFWLIEPLFGGRGFITGHVSPRHLYGCGPLERLLHPRRALPDTWQDPATGEARQGDVWALLKQARKNTAALYTELLKADGMTPGPGGQMPTAETLAGFWQALGSRDYETGTETPRSCGEAGAAEQAAEKPGGTA